jgi:monothiol glutaredoxin
VSTTNEEIHKFLEGAIAENKVMLFMKGTPDAPRCGFSMRTSGALNALGVQYAAMDILPDPRIREELSAISDWPTIPQLFVDGKLIGGCDIVMEMFENGELADLLGVEQPELEPEEAEVEQSGPIGLENELRPEVLDDAVRVVDDFVAIDDHWHPLLPGQLPDLEPVPASLRDADLLEFEVAFPQLAGHAAARAEPVRRRPAAIEDHGSAPLIRPVRGSRPRSA